MAIEYVFHSICNKIWLWKYSVDMIFACCRCNWAALFFLPRFLFAAIFFVSFFFLYKLIIRWSWSLLFARLDRRQKLNWKHSMQIRKHFTRCLPVAFSKRGNLFNFYFTRIPSKSAYMPTINDLACAILVADKMWPKMIFSWAMLRHPLMAHSWSIYAINFHFVRR